MGNNKVENEIKEEYLQVLEGILNERNSIDVSDIKIKLEMLISNSDTTGMQQCPNMSNSELSKELEELKKIFLEFLRSEDCSVYNNKCYDINERNLAEAIVRTFKRKEYYKYFHNIPNISELKQASLLSFWIMKLKPFTVLEERSILRVSVNEKFALNIILSTIQYLLSKKQKEFIMPSKSLIQDTIYSFKYRDLSKEAIMMLADSLAYSQGISIDTWK